MRAQRDDCGARFASLKAPSRHSACALAARDPPEESPLRLRMATSGDGACALKTIAEGYEIHELKRIAAEFTEAGGPKRHSVRVGVGRGYIVGRNPGVKNMVLLP
jgi:hypothetical protein